jgi:hypothetical protein
VLHLQPFLATGNVMGKNKQKPPRSAPMAQLDWIGILHEMDNSDDRTAAIVAGSFLENNLSIYIMARFVNLEDEDKKALFDEEKLPILGSFFAKIEIGFAIGLYDKQIRGDLRKIKNIRNQFAHHLDVRSFDHDHVHKVCDDLVLPKHLANCSGDPEVTNRRARFLDTASHLIARFDLEAQRVIRLTEPTEST